jgi:predicted flap endonuclease-1-like 5' DNA nuclease
MAWFLWQSILALVLAFLLGLLVGWLLWSRRPGTTNDRGRHARSPADQSELTRLRSELATARTDLDIRSRELAECRSAAGNREAPVPVTDPSPATAAPVAPVAVPDGAPVSTPLAEPAAEPIAEPLAEPVAEPVASSASEPVTEPLDRVTEPVEPVTEPVAPLAQPAAAAPGPATEPVPVVAAADTAPVPVAVGEPDDIQRIEGIGPKLGAAMRKAGYGTFAKIADASVDDLRGAAAESGITFLPSVTTWSRQARLLADGDDEGHRELTSRLRSGQERA